MQCPTCANSSIRAPVRSATWTRDWLISRDTPLQVKTTRMSVNRVPFPAEQGLHKHTQLMPRQWLGQDICRVLCARDVLKTQPSTCHSFSHATGQIRATGTCGISLCKEHFTFCWILFSPIWWELKTISTRRVSQKSSLLFVLS